jgi:hypothetical protein
MYITITTPSVISELGGILDILFEFFEFSMKFIMSLLHLLYTLNGKINTKIFGQQKVKAPQNALHRIVEFSC